MDGRDVDGDLDRGRYPRIPQILQRQPESKLFADDFIVACGHCSFLTLDSRRLIHLRVTLTF